MGKLDGKVALITGAARGQGRSHAVTLAREGADIIAIDICRDIDSVPYPLASPKDLAETVEMVEKLDRRIVATQADVRDFELLQKAVDEGVAELGRLDIVLANAGIVSYGSVVELTPAQWSDNIDVLLTGAFFTCKASIPHLLKGKRGGSIVLTSSAAALRPPQHIAHYNAAKLGLVGLMQTLANELGPDMIRVNTIHPASVNTPMYANDATYRLFRPDLVEQPTLEDTLERVAARHAMPVALLEPSDISNAILFLVSDEGRYVTGVSLPVDLGHTVK
jgi:(+)-trans-carveol dehydrogenase